MNKAVLIAAALLVAPLTLSGQEARGGKDRDAPSVQTQKGAETNAPTERPDEQSESILGQPSPPSLTLILTENRKLFLTPKAKESPRR